MARKGVKPKEILAKLRRTEVLRGQGTSAADAIRRIGAAEVGYRR